MTLVWIELVLKMIFAWINRVEPRFKEPMKFASLGSVPEKIFVYSSLEEPND